MPHEMYDSNVNFMAYSIAEKFKGEELKEFHQMFLRVNNAIERARGWDVSYSDYYQALDMAIDLVSEREEKEWEEEEKRLEEEDRKLEDLFEPEDEDPDIPEELQ